MENGNAEGPTGHFLQPLLTKGARPLGARNARTGRMVATRLEAAFDSNARRRGLLGRDGLPPGEALVIAPCALVHTFRMRFALDLLFVSRHGRIVKVRRSVPPSRIAGSLGAFAVIEMAAGELDSSELITGDVIEIVPA